MAKRPIDGHPRTNAGQARHEALATWLAVNGQQVVARVDHAEIDGFDVGAPSLDEDALERLAAPMRARVAGVVAVERAVYTGLRSVYELGHKADRAALVSGLAHGFTHASLRLDRGSVERCVDADAWRIAECEHWEVRGGSWRPAPAALRAALDGKADGRGRWSGQLFEPSSPPLGGFAPYRISLVAGREARRRGATGQPDRKQELKVEVDSPAIARAAAEAIARAFGCEVPRSPRGSRRRSVPMLLWPDGTRASRTNASRIQWARSEP